MYRHNKEVCAFFYMINHRFYNNDHCFPECGKVLQSILMNGIAEYLYEFKYCKDADFEFPNEEDYKYDSGFLRY